MLVSLQDTGLTRLFSARHEFPTEWLAFLNAADGTDEVLTLNLTRGHFVQSGVASGSIFWTSAVSDSRLAFNRTVVTRYRIALEHHPYAPSTINLRLAAIRRLAYEASACGPAVEE